MESQKQKLETKKQEEHNRITNDLSVRSRVHHSELLQNETLDKEHALTQSTVKSVFEGMDIMEKRNNEAIELAWKDIAVTSLDGKALLQGASGSVKGRLLAIMGPSGAGKSTLMNVLARRMGGVDSTGDMIIDGKEYSLSDLKQVSGYVMQEDLLNGNLTVEETLYYTAELRLPRETTAQEKKARIEDAIIKLGLSKCRSTLVGGVGHKSISGGEKKRLCVAMEMLLKPRLLFLDEPTSGLDSTSSFSVCQTLKKLASSGECTVIATIHQPQAKIFHMFDDLILLKSGNIVYYGPTDEVQDFFAEANFPVPPLTNIADHIMDVIQPPLDEIHLENPTNTIVDFGFSPKEISIHEKKKKHASKAAIVVNRSSWWHQFVILMKRSFQEQTRQKNVLYTQLILNIIMGLLIGTVFLRIGDTQSSIIRRSPALFFCAVNQGIFGALITINSFPRERLLTLRERAAGSYYSSAYFLSKILVESLFQIPAPIVFSAVTYFLVGLQLSAAKFFIFTGFMILCSFAATSLALMVSTLARTTDMAVTILPMALEICRLYGGFFLSPKNLPVYFKWLDALSYVKYAYVGISLNELSGLTLTCTDSQLVKGVCPITSGEFTIDALGLNQLSMGSCVGGLLALIVGTRFIAYLGIRYLKK